MIFYKKETKMFLFLLLKYIKPIELYIIKIGDNMQNRLTNYYKSYDIDNVNPRVQKRHEIMNEYGYNFDSNTKTVVDYEKKCSRVLYTDVKMRNNKGKR